VIGVGTIACQIHETYQMVKFHEAPHIVGKLYGGASWNFIVFNTLSYENEFQNPQIFQQTISLFPEHLTLEDCVCFVGQLLLV
jgi:hypothetical protein